MQNIILKLLADVLPTGNLILMIFNLFLLFLLKLMDSFFFCSFSTIENGEDIVAIINLFGCVQAQMTQHMVRGLNVMIRLRKSCFLPWPRLLKTAEKCNWITQNLETNSYDEDDASWAINEILKSESSKTAWKCDDDSDTDNSEFDNEFFEEIMDGYGS